jgi:beta-glucosidase
VLFGDIDPSGRLVQTWPRSLDQLPPMMDYDLRHGRTYAWFRGEPLYPFGHGLSYTSFEYGELRLDRTPGRTTPTVRCTVRNTGTRRGATVPQIYVAPPSGDETVPARAPLALRGFTKVFLDPGEEHELRIELQPWALAHFDVARDEWIEAPGCYSIILSANARQPLRSAPWTVATERRLGRVPERDGTRAGR